MNCVVGQQIRFVNIQKTLFLFAFLLPTEALCAQVKTAQTTAPTPSKNLPDILRPRRSPGRKRRLLFRRSSRQSTSPLRVARLQRTSLARGTQLHLGPPRRATRLCRLPQQQSRRPRKSLATDSKTFRYAHSSRTPNFHSRTRVRLRAGAVELTCPSTNNSPNFL